MAGETILVVDDDEYIREAITLYLENDGFRVVFALDGNQAITSTLTESPDLIILDMMLPGLDGIEVCQELRKTLDTPIIFLSGKGTPLDKSIGLTAGGDDYMAKPFDPVELLARIKALLRRTRNVQGAGNTNSILSYPHLTIDLTSHTVLVNKQPVILSPKEFQLLTMLAQNPDTVISSENLFQSVWGTESYGDHRTVMVHISNIRRKIETDPSRPAFIRTIKGVGYKFCAQ